MTRNPASRANACAACSFRLSVGDRALDVIPPGYLPELREGGEHADEDGFTSPVAERPANDDVQAEADARNPGKHRPTYTITEAEPKPPGFDSAREG